METFILTKRQEQYLNAPRAVEDVTFPTEGYYFIRGILERKDTEGNIYPIASVNWRQSENEEWEHAIQGNSFYLRLDHLFTNYSLHPNITYNELRHQVIYIKSIKVEYLRLSQTSVVRVYTAWDITGFKDAMLDALPYYSLLNPLIMAMEDSELEADSLNNLAVEVAEDVDDLTNEDVDEYLPEDEYEDIQEEDSEEPTYHEDDFEGDEF